MAAQMGGMRLAGVTALALVAGIGGCATGSASSGGGPQGWNVQQQTAWYAATQGSRMLPWDWAMALERPGSTAKFFDGDWLAATFRLIPRGPGLMPVGIARDRQDDRDLTVTKLRWMPGQANDAPWLGFNCAACHTAEIQYQGKALRVDGGPGLTDFQGLVEAIEIALVETRRDPARFDRFARAVLKTGDSPAARTQLGAALDALNAWNARITAANLTDLRPGFARVDAFGHIYNKVALLAGPDTPRPLPSDAPVSYPFLWNTAQADRVQWNGIAQNIKLKIAGTDFDYGALARNAGEVVGVYGDVAVREGGGLGGFKSSVGVANLSELERVLGGLRPPVWPAAFGALDAAKAERGKALFAKRCGNACHGTVAAGDIRTPFKTNVFTFKGGSFPGDAPPGTDPGMACNAWSYTARTGRLEGLPEGYLKVGNSDAPPFGDTAPVAKMLKATVVGSLVGRKGELVVAAGRTWLGVPANPRIMAVPETKAQRLARCQNTADPLLGYRARPLTGIWATAPYLHNGSVATLWDLLLPPEQRPASFFVGSREFDPVRVGYVVAQSPQNSFRFVARDANGTVPGNGNQGHDYGNARLSDEQRWELIEYMKSL